eukprot:6491047-Karenia_brevis.AAC.1
MGKGEGDQGSKSKFLFIWIAIIRNKKPKRVYQENVRSYGSERMEAHLGDLYIIIRILTDPLKEGWASSRDRQILIMFLKCWLYPIIRNAEDVHIPISSSS